MKKTLLIALMLCAVSLFSCNNGNSSSDSSSAAETSSTEAVTETAEESSQEASSAETEKETKASGKTETATAADNKSSDKSEPAAEASSAAEPAQSGEIVEDTPVISDPSSPEDKPQTAPAQDVPAGTLAESPDAPAETPEDISDSGVIELPIIPIG